MDYQAERLGLIVDLAEQSMDIVQRFSNDPLGAANIQTATGPIKNLKQVSADIKSDGQAAIDVAVTELIDDLKTETSVSALIDGLTDTAVLADASADRSESAATLALAASNPFPTTADGLANTSGAGATNRYFSVPEAGDTLAALYRNDAGVPFLMGRSPSAAIVAPVLATQLSTESETLHYGTLLSDVSLPTNAYTRAIGYAAPYDCTAVAMAIATAAAGVGEIQVYRHNGTARGQHTLDQIIPVNLPIFGVNKVVLPNIKLEAGDVVAYAPKTGGFLRGDTTTSLLGVTFDPAPTTVGVAATVGSLLRPSIELTLVKSAKINAIQGRMLKVETGVGVALDSTYVTLGSLAAGTGAPAAQVTTFSLGAKEAVSARSLLSSVRHKTPTLNNMVHYLVVIYRLQSGTSFVVAKTIPVSVMTDASGLAVAGVNELGRVLLEKGDRVHVYSSNVGSAPIIYADGGARGSALSKSSFTVGETVSVTGTYAQTILLDFTTELLASQAMDSRLVSTEAEVVGIKSALSLALTTHGTLDGPSTWGALDRSFGYAVKAAGQLSKFSVNVSAAGQGELHIYKKLAVGSYQVRSITPLQLAAAGVNTFVLDLRVEVDEVVAYAPKVGALARYTADAALEVGLYLGPIATQVGNTNTSSGMTRPALQFVVSSSASMESTNNRVAGLAVSVESTGARVAALEESPATGADHKFATSLLREMFPDSALPAGWTEAGGWTVNNGLVSPVTGGWGCYALSPGYAGLIKRQICAKVRVDDAASVFGLCTSPPENSGGAVALVDGAAKTLRLYSWTGLASAGTYSSEVVIPFSLVVGRSYTLEVYKDGLKSTIRLTDTVTQVSCEVSEDHNAAYRQWHGRAGVMFHSGAIKVDWFNVNGGYPKELRGLIVGDSICEGMYLPLNSPSWAYQVANVRGAEGDFAVAPRAGDETPNFMLRKVHDLDPWKAQYVVLALGTNDISQATWRTNIASLIGQIVAAGGEPILCTQVPRTASQALRTAMNDDVRSGYFGRYRYIDFALCVSLNNDGVNWNPIYDYGDHIHPNGAGHAKMFAQAMLDAPFLVK